MTTRFKLGLVALAVLALTCLAVVLLKDDAPVDRAGELTTDDPSAGERRNPDLIPAGRDPDDPSAGEAPDVPAKTPGLQPGVREPSGIDLSKPDVRRSELDRLLRASEIDWRAVGRLLRIMTEPVPDDMRSILMQELKTGRRNMVMFAFNELRDPNFVEDLFEVLDDPKAARGARAAALQALWKMPGADDDTVALALESRLAGDIGTDRELLYGLAARGGLEATRALVQYVSRSKTPTAVPPYILRTLDVQQNPEAASVIVEAMQNTENPQVLSALVGMAGKPGSSAFTKTLIDLDSDAQQAAVRARVLSSLAKIGDQTGTDYLLERAAEPGEFGDRARRALQGMYSAQPGARSRLVKALDTAGLSAKPVDMKVSVITALGSLKEKTALRGIAHHMDDPSPEVRRASVKAMGGMGTDARPHVDRMRGHYDAGDVQMKIKVAIAFGEIGGDGAISAMEGWLKGKNLTPSLERTLRMSLRAAKDQRDRERKRNRDN